MTHFSNTRIETVCIGDLVSSARAKVAALTCNGKVLRVSWANADSPLRCPFNYGTYDGQEQTRVNLTFEAPPELCAWIRDFEEKIIQEVTNRSEHYLKQELPFVEVNNRFSSSVKEGTVPAARVKLNVSGPRAVRVWDTGNIKTALPSDMRGLLACPLVEAKHLWFNAGRWGVVWELTDLRVEEAELSCPWGNA